MGQRDYGPATEYIEKWKLNRKKIKTKFTAYKLPWHLALGGIYSRIGCYNKHDAKTYNGVKCLITAKELRRLFMDNKAYLMKQPSIDRFPNPDGNYEPSNVRWIEMSENRRLRGLNHPTRKKIYEQVMLLIVAFFRLNKCLHKFRRQFILQLERDLKKEGY